MKQLFLLFSFCICPSIHSASHLPGTRETFITWYFDTHLPSFQTKQQPLGQRKAWVKDYLESHAGEESISTQQAKQDPHTFLIAFQHQPFKDEDLRPAPEEMTIPEQMTIYVCHSCHIGYMFIDNFIAHNSLFHRD